MIALATLRPAETWLAAPGFPTYEVSSWARIRRGSRILKQTPKEGRPGFPRYLVVELTNARGRRQQVRVNRLVALAFHGKPRRRRQVDHVDGNTFHNWPTNLEWVTQAVNQRRSHAMHPRRRDAKGRILARAVAA